MQDTPGKGKAVGSLVCGIISLVFCCFSVSVITAFLAPILGIVGLVLAGMAKNDGFVGGMQTAGFVLSLIGTILGAVLFVTCGICTVCTICSMGSIGALY